MGLPPISPTGAMSSGDYVSYMMGYNSDAADSIIDELGSYMTQSTISDWESVWDTSLSSVESKATVLEDSVDKLNAQIRMVEDAIARL